MSRGSETRKLSIYNYIFIMIMFDVKLVYGIDRDVCKSKSFVYMLVLWLADIIMLF